MNAFYELESCRLFLGWDKKKFTFLLDVSRQTYENWRSGIHPVPPRSVSRIRYVERIAQEVKKNYPILWEHYSNIEKVDYFDFLTSYHEIKMREFAHKTKKEKTT